MFDALTLQFALQSPLLRVANGSQRSDGQSWGFGEGLIPSNSEISTQTSQSKSISDGNRYGAAYVQRNDRSPPATISTSDRESIS